MNKTRLRIRFTKVGDMRWISHRDLARVWERLLRRADLQLAFSEGFHPKPRINFPSALALGTEALDEIVELEVLGEVPLDKIEADIRRELPDGMQFLELTSPKYKLGKARVESSTYRVLVPLENQAALQDRIAEVLSGGTIEVAREKKTIRCDVQDPLFELRTENDYLIFRLPTIEGASIRPSELLDHLGLSGLLESGAVLQRTDVTLREPDLPTASVTASQPQGDA